MAARGLRGVVLGWFLWPGQVANWRAAAERRRRVWPDSAERAPAQGDMRSRNAERGPISTVFCYGFTGRRMGSGASACTS